MHYGLPLWVKLREFAVHADVQWRGSLQWLTDLLLGRLR
jgi:hypothetical protein